MGNLIKAEFRKILTTKLWWALLIPTVITALGWSLATGAIGKGVVDAAAGPEMGQLTRLLGLQPAEWKVSVFGIARSINVATIFATLFGGLAISSEIYRKTITTTFLTAPNRASAMAAKMMVYAFWGLVYGVIIVGVVSIGISLTSDSAALPAAGDWLALAGAGILETILVTLLGVGVGALLVNVVGATVSLLLYMLVIENVLVLWLTQYALHLAAFLPNGSADGITGSVAANVFTGNAADLPEEGKDIARAIAGGLGTFDWWASALALLVWTGVFFGVGWLVTKRRDIT
jgi:ABC-2 type transport system permease protein